MLAKTAFPLLAFAVLVGPLLPAQRDCEASDAQRREAKRAQPAPKPVDDKVLVTKVYNIRPLIGDRGKASGLADADAVLKVIFQAIPQLRDLNRGLDGPQIVELDGGKFEIRATAKRHEEIKDLFVALERLHDLAIDVKADVIELDDAAYEKLLKALPKAGRGKTPVLYATGAETEGDEAPAINKALDESNKVLKAGRGIQTSNGRFMNGGEAIVSARRTIVTFPDAPAAVAAKLRKVDQQIVKEGFALVAVPAVSADRRFVRFKLTEQSTVITGVKKRDFGEIAGEKFVLQSLETDDLGATGSATVADGGTVLFRLAYAPKDKVWVVVLKPTIFIQAEEDELKKQENK